MTATTTALVTATRAMTNDELDDSENSDNEERQVIPPPLPPKTRIRGASTGLLRSNSREAEYVHMVPTTPQLSSREKFVTSVRIASPEPVEKARRSNKPTVHPSVEPWRWESEEVRREITWSVPQLRALFGERTQQFPPPYRYPPSLSRRGGFVSPPTHMGVGQVSTDDTSSGEESYV